MQSEFMLAVFLMAVGVSIAGAGTHLYQGLTQQPAILRYDGHTLVGMFGNLLISFICGPYIMLMAGLRTGRDGAVAVGQVLLAALVGFGWAFITGLLFTGMYVGLAG